MSMDPSDPFDDGQPWRDISSSSPWAAGSNNNPQTQSTASHPTLQRSPSPLPATVEHSSSSTQVHATAPAAAVAATAHSVVTTSITGPSRTIKTPSAPPRTTAEEQPPSYEYTMKNNIPQLHDNYAHLIGPPGQRGDVKVRIPLDSTPASEFEGAGSSSRAGTSGNQAGGSGVSPSSSTGRYGSIPSPSNSHGRLQGQHSYGREDDELHSRDVDRLLGPTGRGVVVQVATRGGPHSHSMHPGGHSDMDGCDYDSSRTYWSVIRDPKAWLSLAAILMLILPWSILCFVWTLVTGIIALLTMIVPPIGYLVVVGTVTSWRALAKMDLLMARSLVSQATIDDNPYEPPVVFVSTDAQPTVWNGGHPHARGQQQQQQQDRMCGARHAKLVAGTRLTPMMLVYFILCKFAFALMAFIAVLVLGVVTVPLIICLLPLLLRLSQRVIEWQFQWAVLWLGERPRPIALA